MKNKRYLIFIIVFFIMFLLNSLTPLLVDDYFYSLKFNSSSRINNILDIIIFQKDHYLNWGGRVISHSLAQIFLLLPKFIFNICNSIMFIIEGYLIYKIVCKEDNNYILGIIYLLLWFINPIFGQINLWLIGSCNYLWTINIILFCIYLFFNEKNNLNYKILLFIFSFLTGMCNENTSLAVIIMFILSCIFIDKKVSKNKIISIILSIIGYLILMLAPGNYTRYGNNKIITTIFSFITKYIYLIIPILILLFIIMIYNRVKKDKILYIYFIGIIVIVFSLIVVPEIFIRNFYSAIIFSLIILVTIIKSFSMKTIKVICIILSIVFSINFIFTINDFLEFNSFYKERESILIKASKEKKKNIKIPKYYSSNSKIPISVDMPDLNYDSKEFPNNVLERYYKIDNIIGYWPEE